ncbi:hypothetical protein BCU68_00830 [Vibrio sp. 10N.286.49.B3]|nr:hypothetical protein BCU68_00830 [Vibrio sp. 10N.286.49.B3]
MLVALLDSILAGERVLLISKVYTFKPAHSAGFFIFIILFIVLIIASKSLLLEMLSKRLINKQN